MKVLSVRVHMLQSFFIPAGRSHTWRENGMNSVENLPSLRRAGAVLFLEFRAAIVDPEKLSQAVLVQKKVIESPTLELTTLEYA